MELLWLRVNPCFFFFPKHFLCFWKYCVSIMFYSFSLTSLKSVINHFRGNREFARLRIGIGRPPGQMDPKAFLLQKFNATARERIDAALPEGVVALRCILFEGLTRTARWFNQEQKYKYIRSETMST